MTGPITVEQTDLLEATEDDALRERRARLLLTAKLRAQERVLAAYVERYGDITTQEGDTDAAGTG